MSRFVYYLLLEGQAPGAPLARFTDEGEAREAAQTLKELGWRAELLARDEDPRLTAAWTVVSCLPAHGQIESVERPALVGHEDGPVDDRR